MLKDLGVDISKNTQIDKAVLEVRIDASAGRGIAARRGAGRIRHTATPTFWVQKLTQDGKVKNHANFWRAEPSRSPNQTSSRVIDSKSIGEVSLLRS